MEQQKNSGFGKVREACEALVLDLHYKKFVSFVLYAGPHVFLNNDWDCI